MTIRPGQASRKSPTSGVTKSSSKGMDVVMMNDFEQRHLNTKSRSHSPFGHIGSPTTPLNFEQLFLQGQLPLSSELSQHEQAMLQAQLLNGMRSSGMAPKPKQQQQSHQPSLAMLDQLRQAYNRGEPEHAINNQEQAEWNVRAFAGQQHREEPSTEPSTIALLQQKFAQMERHKAEMQKSASQPQQVQIYPSQWSMSLQQQQVSNSMPPPPPPVSHESRQFVPTTAGFYSFQQQQQPSPQVMAPPSEVPEQFYSAKQELSWGSSQEPRSAAGWTLGNEMGTKNPSLMYMPPKQQQQQSFQHQTPKVVEYQPALQQQHHHNLHRMPEFAVPPQQIPSFSSFQLNGPPPAPEMGLLGSVVVSSRCDKTGGHSVEFKSGPDHFRSDDSEMSLDNFSGRVAAHLPPPNLSSLPNASQIAFGNSFHMLPQSSKSAFSTFTRQSSNLNPAAAPTATPMTTMTTTNSAEAVVTKSLLFNDTYRRSQEVPDLMHDDVDTELHL